MSGKYEEYEEEYIPFAYLNETEDDYCQDCGTRLVKSSTRVPYGDTSYLLDEYFCPNCG